MTALVLSGGGFAGGAWMLGMLSGLRAHGVDLGEADLVVGTSAGARAAAILTTGGLDPVVAMHREGRLPRLTMPAAPPGLPAPPTLIVTAEEDQPAAARR